MSSYWNAHPNFVHNPAAPLQQEFNRLADQNGWDPDKAQYKREWKRCGQEEFAHHFGRDENRLAGWQAMCATVGVKEVPESIKQCKQVLRTTWINIFDLLDAKRTGRPVKKHASAKALREYTKREDKIFPKKDAKKNRFLKAWLIKMF
ncbi:hypothetical protein MSAN_00839100 [Mycena sanguinolenta]|uniref:Uncharacterized protein n=1 Tax=Mycena sanguinolenta TaxID=230812 RepID=A0A8H7DDN9_9AGAR|nr:hypothetical protein MSAN_00839100 [Mycena sanguinolenta]